MKRRYGIQDGYDTDGQIIIKDGEEFADTLEEVFESVIEGGYLTENFTMEYSDGQLTVYEDGELYENYTDLEEIIYFMEANLDIAALEVVNYKDEYEIVPSTLFLTLREAEEHIERNYYHYRKPHPYAMTAWRSPQVEKLYEIIEKTEWSELLNEMEGKNMKATGITRPLDGLGRVVIPRELRKSLKLEEDIDRLEIFTEGESIILRKYNPGCTFCGELDGVKEFLGKKVCNSCRKALQ